jgi:thiol:disulfide interchange protein
MKELPFPVGLRLWLVCCLLSVAGCQENRPAPLTRSAPEPAQVPDADGPAGDGASQVALQVASWEEVQAAVAAHRGKVVVLDLWATW